MQVNSTSDTVAPVGRIEFLDGLRGCAVLGVVLVHSGQIVRGLPPVLENLADYGSRGVELFFVVSAFTMMAVYARRSRITWTQFYVRRWFRIAPMFYLALVIYSLIAAFGGRPHDVADIVATLFFVHGWSPTAYNNVVPGGWSIACEMMFYLSFPVILVAVRGPVMALTTATAMSIVGLLIVTLGPDLLSPVLGDSARDFLYFSFPAHISSFLYGVAAYLTLDRLKASGVSLRLARPAIAAAWAVVGLLFFCAITGSAALGNFIVAAPLFAALLVTLALCEPRWLGAGVIAMLGRISFSIYLTHFLFWKPVDYLVERIGGPAPIQLLLAYGMMLACSVPLSWATFRWVETPMIVLGHRLTAQRRTGGPASAPS